jgi:small subunit ribosomal protein S15
MILDGLPAFGESIRSDFSLPKIWERATLFQ